MVEGTRPGLIISETSQAGDRCNKARKMPSPRLGYWPKRITISCRIRSRSSAVKGEGGWSARLAMAQSTTWPACRADGERACKVVLRKCLAVDLIREGEIKAGERVVFLHAGGAVGLFGYTPILEGVARCSPAANAS
jgi:hypothetical protein